MWLDSLKNNEKLFFENYTEYIYQMLEKYNDNVLDLNKKIYIHTCEIYRPSRELI